MKSKKQSQISDEEQCDQSTDSVFDFLYHDGRRIASLLAQFDPSGHLSQLSRGLSASRGRQSTSNLDASASIPAVAKLDSKNSDMTSLSHQEDVLRVYDPTWANAREFLNIADEKGLIERDVRSAALGQIVLFKGSLSITDLAIMSKIWELSATQKLINSGIKPYKRPNITKGQRNNPAAMVAYEAELAAANQANLGVQLFMEMVPALPHTIQATLVGDEKVWCSLEREGLTFEASDTALKFGKEIPGEWAMLGILDAYPDTQPDGEIKKVDYLSGQAVAKLFDSILPLIRMSLGRPYEAFGITPLLIFREVKGRL